MEHDYYQILGVAPDADLTAIQTGFRKKSMQHHPDRGGTVEEMRLVIEAWEVLRDPETRRVYDHSRAHPRDVQTQTAAQDNAERARRRAEDFPRRWQDFEKFLDALAGDFRQAEYGSAKAGPYTVPNVKNSVSGILFVLAGAVLGGWLLGIPVYNFITAGGAKTKAKPHLIPLLWAAAPAVGGAWLGAAAHQGISRSIKSRPPSAGPSVPPQTVPDVKALVVTCPDCGQKLRVPKLNAELVITCRRCGLKFSEPAAAGS